ncbi:hypothetical protein AMAG_07832 [Allomyces macrogynus ATCC 38327]|uniref:Uncharacterized protein n=1 Tax=Allomyces macrogynus (strain ATCC 38327) TaxID=578462 RepID=A0A0L0SJQ7_ALLM3|nr:hypothetical protein AMAG_07832 [Allomyces macrogynus ATCC 38327]|eukprot:KNE62635.1 hypothetical protein AMAG_07832 [Allomyces macrogynus ATCC 38327]
MITASPTASTTPPTMQRLPPPPPAPTHSALRSSSSGSDSSSRSGRGRLGPRASLDSDAGHSTTFKSISAPSTPRLQPAETSYEDIRIHFPRLQRAHNPPGAASAPSSRPVSTVPSLALVQQTLGGLLAGGSSNAQQQPLHPTVPGSNLTVATTAAAESRRTSGWSDSASPTESLSAGAATTGRLAAARARILRVVSSHRLFELLALTDAVTALSLALWAWTSLEPAQAAIGALDMVAVALARTVCLVLVGRGYVTAATPASVCLTSLVYALGKTVALASVPGALDGPATAPLLVHAIIAPILE